VSELSFKVIRISHTPYAKIQIFANRHSPHCKKNQWHSKNPGSPRLATLWKIIQTGKWAQCSCLLCRFTSKP